MTLGCYSQREGASRFEGRSQGSLILELARQRQRVDWSLLVGCYLAEQDWQPVACDLTLPAEGPVTGPVENASAVGALVAVTAVVAVETGVEAGIPVTAVEAALGRVPRGTNDRPQRELAAQQP